VLVLVVACVDSADMVPDVIKKYTSKTKSNYCTITAQQKKRGLITTKQNKREKNQVENNKNKN